MPRPRTLLTALLAALLLATLLTATAAQGQAEVLLSQGKPTTASSVENASTPASAATDGDPGTRWSSAFSDPQWLQVDLGAPAVLSRVNLQWESAFASAFRIETSPDATSWTTVHTTTSGTGGVQDLAVSGTGRYVRMVGTTRGTGWGYSLWEFRVYGTTAPDAGTPISQYKHVTASTWEGGNAPPPRSTAAPPRAGPANSPTTSGSASTSAVSPPCARCCWCGKALSRRHIALSCRPMATRGALPTARPRGGVARNG